MNTSVTTLETGSGVPAFHPFYERIAPTGRTFGKIVFAVGIGFAFLLLRLLADKERAFEDWSVLLAGLVTVAMLALYFATHTFRVLLTDVRSRAGDDAYHALLARARQSLADSRLINAGGAFALMNCAIGLTLGVPAGSVFSQITLLIGYALAGFVCGMAAYCIFGVRLVLEQLPAHLAREKMFDYTSPDGCGGTSFIGAALVVFGGVTLVVGVLISVYIVNAPWTSVAAPRQWWLNSVVGFWLAFPYIMSAVAVMLPAIDVHAALREYKRTTDSFLRRELRKAEDRLDDPDDALEKREDVLRARRLELHRMRVWPFDFGAYATYATVLTPNVLATFQSAYKWYDVNIT